MGKYNINLIKNSFFHNSLNDLSDFSFNDKEFDLQQLRFEYNSLYHLFLSNKQHWSKSPEIVFYMNYMCDLLIHYYKIDYVRSDLDKLTSQKKIINAYIKEHFIEKDQETFKKFSEFMFNKVKTDAGEFVESLTDIDQIRDNLGLINSTRSRWSYSRNLAVSAVNYLRNTSLTDVFHELNALLGTQYSYVDAINFLEKSQKVLAIVGIVLYTLRFIINLALILKHVVQSFRIPELSPSKVFKQEVENRGFIMSSDLVWSIVTLMTSYNALFHVTSVAGTILVGSFLIFDALLLLSMWYYEYNKYQKRLNELMLQMQGATELEQDVIQRQIDYLEDHWKAQKAYYMINILGACIISLAFTVTLVFSTPIALGCLALCSMLGNALYNSSTDFKQYRLACLAINREEANGLILDNPHHRQLMSQLLKEKNEAFKTFCKTLIFNVGGIAFIITAAIASWPIALCIAALYVGYQLTVSYQKQLAADDSNKIEHDVYRMNTPVC